LTPFYLNLIVQGKKPVSSETAVKLEALTGASAEIWAQLQWRHDLWLAMHDAAISKVVKQIKRLAVGADSAP
jgi:antitoxin HigA-1